ncbi:MAG: GNAT family N-acetyltransferase [Planctomycetaceae bacterium]|nr:GNAT family N-acetyltransferase [Planctomycetaceae bacterium]
MNQQNSIVAQIRQHSRQLVRELDVVKGVYLGTGYTLSQCHVLFELAVNGSLGLTKLAEILLLDKSNTSRTLKKLVELGLVKVERTAIDSRQKRFSLTTAGQRVFATTEMLANQQVEKALQNLSQEQQKQVVDGLQLYALALSKSRLQSGFVVRLIQKRDNSQIAQVIRDVMTEFKAVGEGYSITDSEVDDIFANYRNDRSCYFVIVRDERVVGGGGIGPLRGGGRLTCEIRKMFLLPEVRGYGLGRRLLQQLLIEARERGYKKCYLETLERMSQAVELYRQNGFKQLDGPLGRTGHCSCDLWYLREL